MSDFEAAIEISWCARAEVDGYCVNSKGVDAENVSIIIAGDDLAAMREIRAAIVKAARRIYRRKRNALETGWLQVANLFYDGDA